MLRDAYIGEEKVARIYTGDKIVHPSPVRDGLVLWYDFMGRKNSDAQRAVAEDLSGNGNDGQLQNFAYTTGSGYEDGLRFDAVDDVIMVQHKANLSLPQALTFDINFTLEEISNEYSKNISKGSGTNDFNYNMYSFGDYMNNGNGGRLGLYANRGGTWGLISEMVIMKAKESIIFTVSYSSDLGGNTYINGKKTNFTSVPGVLATNNSTIRITLPKALLKSFKLYNRALTPEEIAHNYAMEKERWNL